MLDALRRGASVLRENERLTMIMVSTLLVMSGRGMIAPVLPLFARSLGVGATAVGLTLTIFAFARLILNVPLGIVSDRYGRRLLLVARPRRGIRDRDFLSPRRQRPAQVGTMRCSCAAPTSATSATSCSIPASTSRAA